jgi:hypothetical protein
MAQGDIYSIDASLRNSSHTVKIINDSIVLNAYVLILATDTTNPGHGELRILNNNNELLVRLFRKTPGQNWELIEIPIKKLKLNAGEQIQFIASNKYAYLDSRITLMEV